MSHKFAKIIPERLTKQHQWPDSKDSLFSRDKGFVCMQHACGAFSAGAGSRSAICCGLLICAEGPARRERSYSMSRGGCFRR